MLLSYALIGSIRTGDEGYRSLLKKAKLIKAKPAKLFIARAAVRSLKILPRQSGLPTQQAVFGMAVRLERFYRVTKNGIIPFGMMSITPKEGLPSLGQEGLPGFMV